MRASDISRKLTQCRIELLNDAVSDTTDDDSNNAAGNIKNPTTNKCCGINKIDWLQPEY